MINYSIVMRSVNANLFDINQAKSRIKAAEKAGQTPSSEDVALEGQRDSRGQRDRLVHKAVSMSGTGDLLEHRTDGSDAYDTLYIGCEKFPQHDVFAFDAGGVM